MAAVKAGAKAPKFAIATTGGEFRLGARSDENLVVYFYPRDNTPGCTAQACGFRDEFSVIQDKNAVVLGVSGQGAKSHQSFKSKNSLPFPLLSDEDHEMSKQYGVWGEKKFLGMLITNRSHYVIGPDGTIEDIQIGVSPKDSVSLAIGKLTG